MDDIKASGIDFFDIFQQTVGQLELAKLLGIDVEVPDVSVFVKEFRETIEQVGNAKVVPETSLNEAQESFKTLLSSFAKSFENPDLSAHGAITLPALEREFNTLLAQVKSANASNAASRRIVPLDYRQAKKDIAKVGCSLGNTRDILAKEAEPTTFGRLKDEIFEPFVAALDKLSSALVLQEKGFDIPERVFREYANCVEDFKAVAQVMKELSTQEKLGDYLEWVNDFETVANFTPSQATWPKERQPNPGGSAGGTTTIRDAADTLHPEAPDRKVDNQFFL